MKDCQPCLTGAFTPIPDEDCSTFFPGLSRLIFQAPDADPILIADADVQATWATLLAAGTIITPRNSLVMAAITPPEPVTTTETSDGSEIILGTSAKPLLQGMLKNLSPTQYNAIKDLNCRNAKVFLVNIYDQILGELVSLTEITGFKIRPSTLYTNGLQHSGEPLAQSDFMLRFSFNDKNWYGKSSFIDTEFANSIIA